MTEKEWSNIKIGQRVKMNSWDIDKSQDPPKPIDITYYGTIVKANFNFSQVLVKFDSGLEVWKGRLGIEVIS